MLNTVFRANDIVEAHIVAGMLQAEGIKTFVGGHYLQGAVGDLAVQGFADVQVLEEDVDQAITLIAQYESSTEQETHHHNKSPGPADGSILA